MIGTTAPHVLSDGWMPGAVVFAPHRSAMMAHVCRLMFAACRLLGRCAPRRRAKLCFLARSGAPRITPSRALVIGLRRRRALVWRRRRMMGFALAAGTSGALELMAKQVLQPCVMCNGLAAGLRRVPSSFPGIALSISQLRAPKLGPCAAACAWRLQIMWALAPSPAAWAISRRQRRLRLHRRAAPLGHAQLEGEPLGTDDRAHQRGAVVLIRLRFG